MAANKSIPKQMSDSWIVIDEQDESDFVVIDNDNDKQDQQQQSKKTKSSNLSQPGVSNKQQNKRRKWKVLYSLPSTGIQGNVNAANLDSFVMDQHAQLYDKRDLFTSQQRIIKVK